MAELGSPREVAQPPHAPPGGAATPRPPPSLSFLVPEPEDLEDRDTRHKLWQEKLQQELEFLEAGEEHVKEEQKNLKKELPSLLLPPLCAQGLQ
ncbi:26S proteasome regulatory subunit 6B-like [Larus michahellis]|uniref:26S proteasome regulatory subunit 6B-like n=1 Tax=Larus michahellis TaxID=119627 RepID=UPI003D9B9CA0